MKAERIDVENKVKFNKPQLDALRALLYGNDILKGSGAMLTGKILQAIEILGLEGSQEEAIKKTLKQYIYFDIDTMWTMIWDWREDQD